MDRVCSSFLIVDTAYVSILAIYGLILTILEHKATMADISRLVSHQ